MSGPRFGYTQVREGSKLELRPTVNGKLLTPEEADACAVLVACMRERKEFATWLDVDAMMFLVDGEASMRSPMKAYLRAMDTP